MDNGSWNMLREKIPHRFIGNSTRHANTELQDGRTGTIQCSPYQIKLSTHDCAMNAMQVQLNTLASDQTNQTMPKRKHYCWSCGRNYNHGSKICSLKKAGHQDEAYYKKIMGRSEKVYEGRLGAIFNKI